MTGWGDDGPLAHAAGHALSDRTPFGMVHAIDRAGGPPVSPVARSARQRGSQQSTRFVIVRDAARQSQLADLDVSLCEGARNAASNEDEGR